MKTAGQSARLDELVDRLSLVQAADKAQWGRMSAAEMLRHVREALRAAKGELVVRSARWRIPGRALKFLALKVPLRWPRNVPTAPELEVSPRASRPCELGEFEQDRAVTIVKLMEFATANTLASDHPMFGTMSRADWMRWGYLHTDHHLRQFGR